ncbi:site-2 protease family protein [Sulfuriroseicoccus oceanibius]|uniref:Peptidase M50 domain-containing protein n=1 Tax=Sulfuriroseicoccus oceanibius TaxID=2707525 RepID=A0A6B3LBY5_9BACT|nr:site-2 protease family protein [Sulfuriroseicoccus oceanibius]QQL46161.1 hypothetical protein G3M56_006160 [Sulfuriroseicoccus oceanibius]
MIEFRLFGFPIRVQPWFWLTMAFLGGALDARGPAAWSGVILFVAAGFASILIHELGHALAARRFKCNNVSITLVALGGLASFNPPATGLSRPQNIGISAAGPLLQLVAGGLAVVAMLYLPSTHRALLVLEPFALVSIFWGLMNLCLPIFPLDGGQILHGILGPKRVRITLWVGIACCVALAIFTVSRYGFSIWNLMLLGLLASQNISMLKEVNHFRRHQGQ